MWTNEVCFGRTLYVWANQFYTECECDSNDCEYGGWHGKLALWLNWVPLAVLIESYLLWTFFSRGQETVRKSILQQKLFLKILYWIPRCGTSCIIYGWLFHHTWSVKERYPIRNYEKHLAALSSLPPWGGWDSLTILFKHRWYLSRQHWRGGNKERW